MKGLKNQNAEDILSSDELKNDAVISSAQEKLASAIKNVISLTGNEKLDPQTKDHIWQNILTGIPHRRSGLSNHFVQFKRWYLAAATVLLFISSGIYFIANKTASVSLTVNSVKARYHNDILPGGNKAVLTLANGSQIELDNAHNGLLATQGKTVISKSAEGSIIYHGNTDKNITSELNTITTPRGGQYQITLPDGTKAWINAASSLRFPTAFIGKERIVELTGEAYFEVTKNKKMPFKVNANGVTIEVLGTHFNIMAYADESETKTTLLEGAVKVNHSRAPVLLEPGQQAVISNISESVKVKKVDVNNVIAWQKGYYVFKTQNIKSIMRDIARWYDVDIEYKGNVDDKSFSGKISRFKNISEILQLLELTDDIHFKVEGRRVTVMP